MQVDKKLIAKLKVDAEKLRKAKRDKYRFLCESGVPAEIARTAMFWGNERIKQKFGLDVPEPK